MKKPELRRLPWVMSLLAGGLVALLSGCMSPVAEVHAEDAGSRAPMDTRNQRRWLDSQAVQQPAGGTLMRAFGSESVFGHGHAYPYDQAMAVMAFLSEGDPAGIARAESILATLESLQNPDGSWYFSYSAENPGEVYSSRKLGAQAAWVVMAANYHAHRQNSGRFLPMAVRAMDWIGTLQESSGGVRGGDGISWMAVEHNLDAYSAWSHLSANLIALGLPDGTHPSRAERYSQAARRCREWIESRWIEPEGRFGRGGGSDNYTILDVNSWGVLALGSQGWQGADFGRGINWAIQYCRLQDRRYDTQAWVDGFDFNYDPDSDYSNNRTFSAIGGHTGDGRDTVWSEGTMGMVLAFHALGRRDERDHFLTQVGRMIHPNGGILYATNPGSSAEYAPDGSFEAPDGKDDTESCVTGTSTCATSWYLCAVNNWVNPFDPFPVVRNARGIFVHDNASNRNLVDNGDFSRGLDAWTNWGRTTVGSGRALVGTEEGGAGQIIRGLGPARTLKLGGWLAVSTPGEIAYLGVDCLDAQGRKIPGGKFVLSSGSTQGVSLERSFTTVPMTAMVQVYLYKNPGPGRALFDEIQVY